MAESLQRLALDKKYKQEKERGNSKNMSTDRIMTRLVINYDQINNITL